MRNDLSEQRIEPGTRPDVSEHPRSPRRHRLAAVLALLVIALAGPLARSNEALAEKPGKAPRKPDKPTVYLPAPSPPATPAPPPDAKPYDPQLMRLAEILGALTYLRGLCGEKDSGEWRDRMRALLDAEGTPALRKDRLAGAFNAGLQGYELSYRTCTGNARAVIARFLAEGSRLAQDVENRFRAS